MEPEATMPATSTPAVTTPPSSGIPITKPALPPMVGGPDMKVRAYREEEQGTGKVCPTCKAMVPLRTYPGHFRFCYKCDKCLQYKTNRSQHDPICKGVKNAVDGVPCPYCNGLLVADMLRHVQQKHNFNHEQSYIFRKNKVERGTMKEDRRKAKLNTTNARKKLAKIAQAEVSTPESVWASMILQATVRAGTKSKSPTTPEVPGTSTSPPAAAVEPITSGTPPALPAVSETNIPPPTPHASTLDDAMLIAMGITGSPPAKVGSVHDSDSVHEMSIDREEAVVEETAMLEDSNVEAHPADTAFIEDMETEEVEKVSISYQCR